MESSFVKSKIQYLFKEMEQFKKIRDRNSWPENNTKTIETNIGSHRIRLFMDFDNVEIPQKIFFDNLLIMSFYDRRIPNLTKVTERVLVFLKQDKDIKFS